MSGGTGQSLWVPRATGRALARYVAFVFRSSRKVSEPPDTAARFRASYPQIVAFWHGQFMMLPALYPREHGLIAKAMVARHKDAEQIAVVLDAFGMELIRGSGAGERKRDRGGVRALREAVATLQGGQSVCMTADIPPGPARRAGLGIITLARLSGRPIVPCAAATSRYRSMRTWSRMTINLPYSKLAFVVGDPIHVPHDADEATMERLRREVEDSLNAVTLRAYALAGADPARATPPSVESLRAAPPAAPGLALKTYRGLTTLVRPLTPLLLQMRERQGKEDPARRGERFGVASQPRPSGPLVWVHAASIGETNAILPLTEAISKARPDVTILLTTVTVTSARIAGTRLGPRQIHQFLPLDAAEYVRRFLDHWRPDLAVFTESEIWPNAILETSQRSIPLALVNARMSRGSFGRWRRLKSAAAALFGRFDVVLAQNAKLGRMLTQLGARNAVGIGNLKIDAPPPPVDSAKREALKAALGGRPILLAASTHEGEEEVIAAAHRKLAQQLPGLCTLIAPRHPERGLAVAELMKAQGLGVALRSSGALPEPRTDVYVADTIGELGTLYSLAPLAFVGGSLAPKGGQNPIEAIRLGSVVMTGPSWHNFQDSYATLLRLQGAVEVRTADDVAATALRLLRDEGEMTRMRAAATAGLATLSGALARTLEELLARLPNDEGLRRAS